MPSQKLSRTTYRDPYLPGNPIRTGDAWRAEADRDLEEYYRPLEQIHSSGAHGWGVADGLRVTATRNQPDVKVLPGIAIDLLGRHIALAVNGNAEIGPNADAPGTAPTLIGVIATGATIPTAGMKSGAYYLAIQWWETFDSHTYQNTFNPATNSAVYIVNHTPWIRVLTVGGPIRVDDGLRLVLARVVLDAGGIVTDMTHELRRSVSLPAQVLRLRKGFTASEEANLAVDNTASGEIRARAAGGMELAVPSAANEIHLLSDDIVRGSSFARLVVAADQIAARLADGRESVVIDTQRGDITAGTNGIEGDILVKDANDRLVIALNGDNATIVVGATANKGEILVKDNVGQNSVRMDGATGDIEFRGLLKDPNGAHPGIGHDLLRHLPELTSGGSTKLHQHLNSGDATRAIVVPLICTRILPSMKVTVSLTTKQSVVAFIAITSLTLGLISLSNFSNPSVFALIDTVDGSPPPKVFPVPGLVSFFKGQAKDIVFSLSIDKLREDIATAVGVVFPKED